MLLSKSNVLSCDFPSFTSKSIHQKQRILPQLNPKFPTWQIPVAQVPKSLRPGTLLSVWPLIHFSRNRGPFQVCRDSGEARNSGTTVGEQVRRNGEGGHHGINWTTSILLFGLWVGLLFYVFRLAPDQTPYRDIYFIKKLMYLQGDDGYKMNEVLVAMWNIMGLWPLIYSMLLLPTGRSSKSKVPVWPFLLLSFFGGAYALIPYFVIWKPPPPAIGEDEIRKWPFNLLESRITAWLVFGAGLGLMTFAGFANGGAWKEFDQFFRESKFIHVMSLDFLLLSSFAPFWVYNDMTSRRCADKASWFIPLSFVPFLGPALYVALRPRLADLPMRISPAETELDPADVPK